MIICKCDGFTTKVKVQIITGQITFLTTIYRTRKLCHKYLHLNYSAIDYYKFDYTYISQRKWGLCWVPVQNVN